MERRGSTTVDAGSFVAASPMRADDLWHDRYPRQIIDLLHLKAGSFVLDLGCGSGQGTLGMGAVVGERGWVMGVDADAAQIAQARVQSARRGMNSWVQYGRASANKLPFNAGTFDACYCAGVLQYTPDPLQMLREMRRVIRIEGWVCIYEPDWGSMTIDCDDATTLRALARGAGARVCHATAGRALAGWFNREQFRDVLVMPITETFCTLEHARRRLHLDAGAQVAVAQGWCTGSEMNALFQILTERDASGQFFGFVTRMLVAGRKGD